MRPKKKDEGRAYLEGYRCAGEYIGKSESSMKRYRASGRLKGFKVGGEIRFDREELDRFKAGLTQDSL